MKKTLLILLTLLILTSCTRQDEKTSGVTFTDDLSRTVTVSEPKRTAALIGSMAQIWTLAGGDVVACPDDAWEDLDLDLPDGTVNLGKISKLSLEALLEAEPDFILASPNNNQQISWKDTFESMEVPTAYFEVYDFDDYLHLLDICTDITGRKDLYEKYGESVRVEIDMVLSRKRTDSPKVLSMLASNAYLKAKNSDGSVMGAMLRDLGCVNLADSESGLLENLSIEYILQEDPDYIFITQRGDDEEGMRAFVQNYFDEHPAWKQLSAVKNGRVYFMDKNLYNLKPNHRWAEAYRGLMEILSR
ncbi:MAG: ABC transporter substrate-binding protein [Bullifex sp.]